MKHALVVGGSGMLAKASLWLADQGYIVSVIGRSSRKMNKLTEACSTIIPMLVDYNDEELLTREICSSVAAHGAYNIVVAWIHRNDAKIIHAISNAIRSASDREWSLYHVLGSRSNLDEIGEEIGGIPNCEYHQVQLGFVIENEASRWLTNDEISNGVIHSIQNGAKRTVVGTLTPWEKRP
ncbi:MULTISPECIES: short-chain dehydrogenase [Paenibacillus]|uniref:Short-chain dehydrogenase n=1 Tax=Paenibacillus albilobatus TaxID=2716884 RepID=A0A919XFB4_9BACL|nr:MULTISPECIES: short-chain dehydrogenase [Paenibacillus]GIO31727.1 short-chain dehydrogenase [Paenibacillus albilobatus]